MTSDDFEKWRAGPWLPTRQRWFAEIAAAAKARTRGHCAISDCARRVQARGLCFPHYHQVWQLDMLGAFSSLDERERGEARRKRKGVPLCSETGCWKVVKARGLCEGHYDAHASAGTLPESRRGAALALARARRSRKVGPPSPCRHCTVRETRDRSGYCKRCKGYRREKGRWPSLKRKPLRRDLICGVSGCGRAQFYGGLCRAHAEQRRTGKIRRGPPREQWARKLTPAQIAEARARRSAEKLSYSALAQAYGVGLETMWRMINSTRTP